MSLQINKLLLKYILIIYNRKTKGELHKEDSYSLQDLKCVGGMLCWPVFTTPSSLLIQALYKRKCTRYCVPKELMSLHCQGKYSNTWPTNINIGVTNLKSNFTDAVKNQ